MLFGAFQHWDQDTFDLSGAQDIINMYFARATHDPSIAVSGLTQILQFHKARSLGVSSVRFTPIFTSGAWHNLYAVRINSFVLFAMLYIDKPYSMIEKKIEEFQTTLIQSRLEIPIEASTSFLQTAWKVGLPAGCSCLQEPPVLLRLYAKRETLAMLYSNIKTGATVSEGIHKLYVLLSSDTQLADIPTIAADILKNIRSAQ
nr:hypothetical protein HK105_000705 [Polyrhizophydium stewartii]